jgi:hypothetical protein
MISVEGLGTLVDTFRYDLMIYSIIKFISITDMESWLFLLIKVSTIKNYQATLGRTVDFIDLVDLTIFF